MELEQLWAVTQFGELSIQQQSPFTEHLQLGVGGSIHLPVSETVDQVMMEWSYNEDSNLTQLLAELSSPSSYAQYLKTPLEGPATSHTTFESDVLVTPYTDHTLQEPIGGENGMTIGPMLGFDATGVGLTTDEALLSLLEQLKEDDSTSSISPGFMSCPPGAGLSDVSLPLSNSDVSFAPPFNY